MILKEISLHGFKSFARPVTLDFSSPLTAVVGPNGSGKSNIVDAVRWVLGEQSPTTLRGSQMADVIFSGSDSRKAMKEARVSLKIDNSQNILPHDEDEVTITREVDQDGKGSYIINGKNARLKDIEDLLYDTGLNQDAYSIVGQGRVEAILQSRPEKLRQLFEEAAGISRHRNRKEEAEKRLDKTARDLERVNDLINEIERRLGPLEKKAEKARKYKKLYNQLKEIEVSYLCQQLGKYDDQEAELDKKADKLKVRLHKLQNQLETEEAKEAKLKEKMADTEAEKDELVDKYYQFKTRVQEIENNLKVMSERRQALIKEKNRLKAEEAEINAEIEKTAGHLDGLSGHLDTGKDKLESYQLKLEEVCRALEDNARRQVYLKARSKENQSKELMTSQSELKEELAELQEREQSYFRQVTRLRQSLNQLDDQLEAISEKETQLERKGRELVAEINQYQDKAKELAGKYETIQAEYDSLKENENKAQQKYNRTRSRWQALKKMADKGEGYYRGVRSVWQNENLDGIIGPVAELITTPEKYEEAIATALGSRLQQVVVEDDTTAQQAIEYLKSQQKGRATFLPLNMINGRKINPDRYNLNQQEGYLGLGSELIEYEARLEEIIKYLLGRTAIFKDLKSATAASKASGKRFKIVTLEGDIINPGGAMTGGSQRKDTAHLLSRQRQLEELTEQGKKNRQQLSQIRSQLNEKEKELQAINSEKTGVQEELADLREELKVCQTRLNNIQERKDELDAEVDSVNNELKTEKRSLQAIKDKKKEAEQKLDKVQNQASQQESKQADIDKILQDTINYKDRLQRTYQQFQLELARQEEQISSRRRQLSQQESELLEYKDRLNEINQELERIEGQLEQQTDRQQELEKRKADTEENKAEAGRKKENVQGKLDNLKADLDKLTENLKLDRKEEKELEEEIHQIQLKTGKLKARQERIIGRLEDKYGTTPEEAARQVSEENESAADSKDLTASGGGDDLDENNENLNRDKEEVKDPAATIKKLEKKINALGQVNLAAIDDYRELKDRYDYLKSEQEDLYQAKEAIEEVIADLEEKMSALFYETYQEVNEQFKDIFTRLFIGGEAYLELTEPDDLLNTGVEISASPPGKKLQKLSLLSGGEKAMTAISLVFAFLKVKPSPFYVLDEIDAPLDDANIEIFADFIQEFVEDSQFILITHRKQMMAAADCIYGVTMAENGISRLVSINLEDDSVEAIS